MGILPDETLVETFIESRLCQKHIQGINGETLPAYEYHSITPQEYDKEHCLIPGELLCFIKETQEDEYNALVEAAGTEQRAIKSILARVTTELNRGTLNALRTKIDVGYGVKIYLAFYRPESDKTPEHVQAYYANRLAIVRQLRYSVKNDNEIDMAIFLNGVPILTIELKNTFTGQRHHNAIKQYMQDRPIRGEQLLAFNRCLVHFAVGTEQIFMTTKLDGYKTRFFPFNKCFENIGVDSEYVRTEYLWEDVLRRDSLLDLVGKYINLQITKTKEYDSQTKKLEEKTNVKLIFPRYHQRRAVERLIHDVKQNGVGHRYLIQHSAGSGKSNTIAWLAYRLSGLYANVSDDHTLFDSTIVVTDRTVLDKQLRDNIKGFEQTPGEVVAVVKDKDYATKSAKLQAAIEGRRNIIITTLQTFPVISDTIQIYKDRHYAVIIDEAHSSQSGEAARQMRKTLSLSEAEIFDKEIEEENDSEKLIKQIVKEIERKGLKKNISFFAFTATPKPKTIELFCELEYGTKEAFDCYTMEEAIKEGFILDVMENYMSFSRYYTLVHKQHIPDKYYETAKAVKLLTNFADLQDEAIEQRAEIMIEHFASITAKEIGGLARAMVVTRSRLHAVRFKRCFDEIMQKKRLPYGALVAFSGTVRDEETGEDYTESSMNDLKGQYSITEAFKLPKYRILIVANKFQTGFDEPMLQTMFVDKRLSDAMAVQTLSRLNRRMSGKTSTMILDFVNDPEAIRTDFQHFYGKNKMEELNMTDPNTLYDVKGKIHEFGILEEKDLEDFATIFFLETENSVEKLKLNAVIDRVCDRAIKEFGKDGDRMNLFRRTCTQFVNLYKFLCQIITFKDVDLEKHYVFLVALIKKLPYNIEEMPYDVLNEAELESYKIKYNYTKSLKLESGDSNDKGLTPGALMNVKDKPEEELLTKIIKRLNDTYGLNMSEEDKADLEGVRDRLYADNELMDFFNPNNSRDNIKDRFNEAIDEELLDFVNQKFELYNKLTDERVNGMLKQMWFNELYNAKIRGLSL